MQFKITLDGFSNGKLHRQKGKGKERERKKDRLREEKKIGIIQKDFTVSTAKSTVNNIWSCRIHSVWSAADSPEMQALHRKSLMNFRKKHWIVNGAFHPIIREKHTLLIRLIYPALISEDHYGSAEKSPSKSLQKCLTQFAL